MDKKFFQIAKKSDLDTKRKLDQKSQMLSWLRLCSFFFSILALVAAWDWEAFWLYIVSLTLAVFFVLILRHHNKLLEKRLLLESHIAVLSKFLARLTDKWRSFSVTGAQYLTDDIPQTKDLNIFGTDSIYQYICAAHTKAGRDRLGASLSPFSSIIRITYAKKRQKAVAELIAQPTSVLDLMAKAALLPEHHDTEPLLKALQKNIKTPYKGIIFIAWLLPASLMLAVGAGALSFIDSTAATLILLLQLLISLTFTTRTANIQKPLSAMHRDLHLYEQLFAHIELAAFQSQHLKSLQAILQNGGAAQSLRCLCSLADHAHMRHNLIFWLLSNALYLNDIHFTYRIIKWQKKAARHLDDWLNVWAEVEVLLSFATIGLVRETYTFPELLEEGSPRIKAKGLTHLLLSQEKAVPNGIETAAGTRIITGSNMSGKTTYLRTIASACILSYAGAPVPGEMLHLSPLHIFTSIRVTDDIAQGLSTFYAEILRIKSMMKFKEKKLPMLIVIDEIFKGTNSADRLIGAKEAITRLTGANFITLVSTHDLELCSIKTNAAPVTNWHFEESYENDKLTFDYKIKKGRCTTQNARYLLKMAGILD